jgi:hypothetical protein
MHYDPRPRAAEALAEAQGSDMYKKSRNILYPGFFEKYLFINLFFQKDEEGT